MSPWTKAKVFGMHAIAKLKGWKIINEDSAKVVKKVGGGSPSDQAIRDLRTTFDSDPHWHRQSRGGCSEAGAEAEVHGAKRARARVHTCRKLRIKTGGG